LADANGKVKYPNVDLATESVNALEPTRAYEANITAIETTKTMLNATVRILA
jgi:flagellar basal-body rod protein FlgC